MYSKYIMYVCVFGSLGVWACMCTSKEIKRKGRSGLYPIDLEGRKLQFSFRFGEMKEIIKMALKSNLQTHTHTYIHREKVCWGHTATQREWKRERICDSLSFPFSLYYICTYLYYSRSPFSSFLSFHFVCLSRSSHRHSIKS